MSFDLDGTLLDDGSRWQQSIVDTCTAIAAARPELDAGRLVATNAEVWESYFPQVEMDWMLGTLDGTTLSLEAWRRTLLACGCDDEPTVRMAVEAFHRFEREAQRLFDDVSDLFDSLKATDLLVALVTNGASDTQRGKLAVLGIGGWFDSIVISGELGIVKPDPRIFETTLEELGIRRQSLWHVGDSLSADVAGSNAAGIVSVWLNRRRRVRQDDDPSPDYEIRSLAELASLLTG